VPARGRIVVLVAPDVVVGPAAPAGASRGIRVLAWLVVAWCLGFAAVNVVFEVTGRFAGGPHAELAAGLAVMDWLVVGLKLLGAAVAVRSVRARPASAVRTVLVWGAFALLALYSAGGVVELVGLVLTDPGRIEPAALAYLGFFVAGAVGYGVLAVSYARRTRARRAHLVIGVLGAPVVLGLLLVAAPAALAAMGLLPAT
jgi:hypothetical protein